MYSQVRYCHAHDMFITVWVNTTSAPRHVGTSAVITDVGLGLGFGIGLGVRVRIII